MVKYLPLLFLLACPLMMMFMMRGMGAGGRDMGHDMNKRMPRKRDHTGDRPGDELIGLDISEPNEQAQIARLEREVAELRAARERDDARDNTSFSP